MPTAALAKASRKATLFSGDDGKTGIKQVSHFVTAGSAGLSIQLR
jgi:hypothetical protein